MIFTLKDIVTNYRTDWVHAAAFDFVGKLFSQDKEMWKKNFGEGPIDITVTCNGVEVDFEEFINRIANDYERQVKEEAKRLVNERFENLSLTISDIEDEMRQKLQELNDEAITKLKEHILASKKTPTQT